MITALKRKGPQSPVALDLGSLSLVLPDARRRLTDRQWADLRFAVVLDNAGLADPARDVVADIERRMKVNPAHRIALATSPEQVTDSIRKRRDHRADAVQRRAAWLAGAIRLPEPTDEIVRLVRRAEALEVVAEDLRNKDRLAKKRTHSKAIRQHRDDARSMRRRAEALRQAQVDAHWADVAMKESADYAIARGEEIREEVVVRAEFATDDEGRLLRHRRGARPAGIDSPGYHSGDAVLVEQVATRRRVLSHGGLQLAYERGDLDEGRGAKREAKLYATAQRYQRCYETVPGMGPGPGMNDGGRSSADPAAPFGQESAADRRRDLVTMRENLGARQRDVLDYICGQDFTLGATAKALRAGVPSIRRALRGGLAQALADLITATEEARQNPAT